MGSVQRSPIAFSSFICCNHDLQKVNYHCRLQILLSSHFHFRTYRYFKYKVKELRSRYIEVIVTNQSSLKLVSVTKYLRFTIPNFSLIRQFKMNRLTSFWFQFISFFFTYSTFLSITKYET